MRGNQNINRYVTVENNRGQNAQIINARTHEVQLKSKRFHDQNLAKTKPKHKQLSVTF